MSVYYIPQQSVQWAIHVFRWLYSDLVVVNKLLQDWVGTVNTALLSYVEQVMANS